MWRGKRKGNRCEEWSSFGLKEEICAKLSTSQGWQNLPLIAEACQLFVSMFLPVLYKNSGSQ